MGSRGNSCSTSERHLMRGTVTRRANPNSGFCHCGAISPRLWQPSCRRSRCDSERIPWAGRHHRFIAHLGFSGSRLPGFQHREAFGRCPSDPGIGIHPCASAHSKQRRRGCAVCRTHRGTICEARGLGRDPHGGTTNPRCRGGHALLHRITGPSRVRDSCCCLCARCHWRGIRSRAAGLPPARIPQYW